MDDLADVYKDAGATIPGNMLLIIFNIINHLPDRSNSDGIQMSPLSSSYQNQLVLCTEGPSVWDARLLNAVI